MRTGFLTTFFLSVVLLVCGCSKYKFYKSEVLWTTNHESIFVETWFQNAMFGQEIYLVCQRDEMATNKVVLFTILPEFQESEPGYPRFHRKDGEAFIQDVGTSYIFSIKNRSFITNAWPNDVYLGNYTNGPNIPSKP
ncbi:MAG: hypothetical protein ABSE90_05150 [Verrucomicrobiota bacterium]|jgi:hypothetical protein